MVLINSDICHHMSYHKTVSRSQIEINCYCQIGLFRNFWCSTSIIGCLSPSCLIEIYVYVRVERLCYQIRMYRVSDFLMPWKHKSWTTFDSVTLDRFPVIIWALRIYYRSFLMGFLEWYCREVHVLMGSQTPVQLPVSLLEISSICISNVALSVEILINICLMTDVISIVLFLYLTDRVKPFLSRIGYTSTTRS